MSNSLDNKVAVSPEALLKYLNKGLIPEIPQVNCVIILYDNSLLKFIKRHFKVNKIKGFTSDCYSIEDKILICHGFGIGSPAAVDAMEGLIAAGARRFISIGTAGGISIKSKLGDIVVCNKALIDEGTSSHYFPGKKYSYPHMGLTNELFDLIQKEFKYTTKGSTWTTDAPFRETFQKLIEHQKKGIQTVEMEASALFTLGKYRNVEVASIFVIGDLLSSEGWHPGFLQKKVQTNSKHVVNNVIKYYLADK
jgi:uridine phosphorylase